MYNGAIVGFGMINTSEIKRGIIEKSIEILSKSRESPISIPQVMAENKIPATSTNPSARDSEIMYSDV